MFLRTLTAMAVVLTLGVVQVAPGVAVAAEQAPQSVSEAIVARTEAISVEMERASTALGSIDFRALLGSPDRATLQRSEALLAQAEAQASSAARTLAAMPAWPGDSDEDRLVDQTARDAAAFAADMAKLARDLRQMVSAMLKGDQATLKSAALLVQAGSVRLMEGQALGARSRAALLPVGSTDRELILAQGEVLDGIAVMVGYAGRVRDGAASAKRLRRIEANGRRMVARARALSAEAKRIDLEALAGEPKGGELVTLVERSYAINEAFVQSIERCIGVIETAAGKLEAAGSERISLRQDMTPLEQEGRVMERLGSEQMDVALRIERLG
ncbi:hypothetical protein [Caulobacter endophyticus]|uniref:hypothetical protein n=1 Tax=Caulobacter endophyticus TaxID=2172652 RepID=UPI00240FEF64|nr:hypothetical protein [Caulobacter endophyticus]MDG2528607.1 hypothetical protein [Caulobacter endophyticus]